MTLYLDTSLLVAFLTNEASSESVEAWMQGCDGREFASSAWVATEFSAALSIKMRSGRIDAAARAGALARFAAMYSDAFIVLSISESHFRTAARFADQYPLGLRSGDALHLAIAASHGATLCTLDQRLADAGPPLGLPTLLV
ncbi:MAG: type II toxin-antitoxin system VapC family toxin [Caulobacteraceae bacterium]